MRPMIFMFSVCLMLITGCGTAQPASPPVVQQNIQPAVQPQSTASPTPETQTATPVPAQPQSTTVIVDQAGAIPTFVPPAEGTITITAPAAGAAISNPVTVKGSTDFWPFEATLVAQIKDAAGNVLGIGPITIAAPDIGHGGPFEEQLSFTPPAQAQDGTLEVFEASAKDGSIVVITTVPVRLSAATAESGLILDAPAEGAAVTLPLHVAFRGAQGQSQVIARLRYTNGVVLEQPISVVMGSDGIGYGVANMAWNTESAPPATPSGVATFELVREDGALIKRVAVNVLPEAETQQVNVAWVSPGGQDTIVFSHNVPRTPRIASAAIQQLLNGPPDGNLAGAETALPSLQEIVTFAGRESDWGYEVKLLRLVIENGVATVNFSKELQAYGGGSARVQAIRMQIEQTLKQFPSVQDVVIQIEGQSEGVLQP